MHHSYGRFDPTTGDFVVPSGHRLTPDGIYLDPDGTRPAGDQRFRYTASGTLTAAIPPADAAHPRPLPPLIPTGPGWPDTPDGHGWPNIGNPAPDTDN